MPMKEKTCIVDIKYNSGKIAKFKMPSNWKISVT
jgi:hypothetical protein